MNANCRLVVSSVLILIYDTVVLYSYASREERFLHFPPKTNIVMTMSLLKLIPNDTIINTLTEFDVLFPIPLHPFENRTRKKREIERNAVFTRLKEIVETFGFDGNACLTKLICELSDSLPPTTPHEDNLLYDIFNLIFEPERRMNAEECKTAPNTCQIPGWINF